MRSGPDCRWVGGRRTPITGHCWVGGGSGPARALPSFLRLDVQQREDLLVEIPNPQQQGQRERHGDVEKVP